MDKDKKTEAVTGAKPPASDSTSGSSGESEQKNSGGEKGSAGSNKVSDKSLQLEKDDLLNKIREIEKDFDGNTSNIPINHEYWDLMNAFRRKAR